MKLELTEKQYIEIMEGMEFYQRFIIGQPDGNSVLWDRLCEKGNVPYHEYDAWKHSTNRLFFPELSPGASYGYSKEPISYEIWREMKHQWTKKNHSGDTWNVYLGTTLHSSSEPLIQVTF